MKKIWLIALLTMFAATMAFAAEESKPMESIALSLDECLQMGFQNNNQLLLTINNVEIYKKEVQRAYSGFLPTISYNITGYLPSYYDDGYNSIENDYFTKGITLSQMLFNGGVTYLNYANAKLNLTTALEDKRKTEQNLTYQIKAAFYDLWLKQQNLSTAVESEKDMEKHYQLVDRMYKAGSSNKLELYQARGRWEEQKVATESAKNEMAQAKLALATLINIDRYQEFKTQYDLLQFKPLDVNPDSVKTVVEEAYRDRPEMHKAKLAIEVAENNVKLQKAKVLPSLGLNYDYSLESEKLSATEGTKKWYLVFSLSGTLFDGFNYQAGMGVAKQQLESAQLQENIQRDQILTEVTQSLQSLKQSYDLIKSTSLNVSFMKERVYLTRLQYENGKADTTEVIDAQSALDKALNSYYGQVMSYLTAKARLDFVLGIDTLPQQ